MPHPNGMLTLEELRSMPEDELVKRVDQQYSDSSLTSLGLVVAQIYHDELVRRNQDSVTKRMLFLTWVIAFLTAVMLIGLGVQIYLAWE